MDGTNLVDHADAIVAPWPGGAMTGEHSCAPYFATLRGAADSRTLGGAPARHTSALTDDEGPRREPIGEERHDRRQSL